MGPSSLEGGTHPPPSLLPTSILHLGPVSAAHRGETPSLRQEQRRRVTLVRHARLYSGGSRMAFRIGDDVVQVTGLQVRCLPSSRDAKPVDYLALPCSLIRGGVLSCNPVQSEAGSLKRIAPGPSPIAHLLEPLLCC